MIISIPKVLRRLYFLIMFVALSYVLYCVMGLLQNWISPMNDHGIPEGSAIKAFHEDSMGKDTLSTGQRLHLYYWYGE